MQLTKESQDKIKKAAAALSTTEAKILVDLSQDTVPIFIEDTIGTMSATSEATISASARSKLAKAIIDQYKKDMFVKKGSMCIEEVVEDIGGGKVKAYTRQTFRPWVKDIPRREVQEISNKIATGSAEFKNPRIIAKSIGDHFGGTRHNAIVGARTESLKIQNEANLATRREAGQEYLLYVTAGDDRVRPSHVARSGKYYPISNPPDLGEYQCRCTLVDGTLDVLNGAPVEESSAIIMDKDQYYAKV